MTVKVCPAIVSVPLRAAPVLAATVNPTDPLPVAEAPDVMLIQAALETAVHAHVPAVVTVTDPFPPPTATVWLVAETEKEQLAPSCVTVNV